VNVSAGKILSAVSAGGVVGALARYGIQSAFPASPWVTFAINVTGCLLIGVLMVFLLEVWPPHPLLRPFLGTGVLGGYTTFSTYIVDIQHLLARGVLITAFAYLAGTLLAALAAVYAGIVLTREVTRPRRRYG
jgi:CrcB protein